MFSSTTMASSTTSPMASTMPNSVSTLMENPSIHTRKKTPTSEMGMARTGMRVQRQSRKNAKMTTTTRKKAIQMVSSTSFRDVRTKRVLSAERSRKRSEEHTSELQSRQYLVC